jgi:hypothetical protein
VRSLLSAPVIVVAALLALSANALAADAPWQQARLDHLNAQITSLNARVAAAQARLDRTAARLATAADRVNLLHAEVAEIPARVDSTRTATTLWTQVRALVLLHSYQHARTVLDHVQHMVVRQAVLPKLAHLEVQRDRLRDERNRMAALVSSAAGVAPTADVAAPITREGWARALLQTLNLPNCPSNLVSLVAWQTAENTSAAWNPLATTLPAAGSTGYNKVGVQNYGSIDAGLHATAQTLRWGYDSQGYGWIIYRLSRCAKPMVTARAIRASNWCHGCAGGEYVTGMVEAVRADYAGYAGL